MRVCGIISEYNPFHAGHLHHLRETRARIGEDCALVCCMSGDFVQRGEPALLPKHLRAEAAVACGADLVIELPAPYALRSAEHFARAGVALLAGLGTVTDLSFGAEDADVSLLTELADTLLEHQTVLDTLTHLTTGLSYAAARERALYDRLQAQADLLHRPNNILAVEYCKAVRTAGLDWTLHAVPRAGGQHDGAPADGLPSASWLRTQLRAGDRAALAYLPDGSRRVLERAGERGLLLLDTTRAEHGMLDRLCRMRVDELAALPDASEGLEHRLYAAIRSARTAEEICAAARSRRYPLARIRRMLCCAWLDLPAALTSLPPPYIRVLALNDRGRRVLRMSADAAALPIINKPAHIRALSDRAQEVFGATVRAGDLYHLTLPGWKTLPLGLDWRQGAQYFPENPPQGGRKSAAGGGKCLTFEDGDAILTKPH